MDSTTETGLSSTRRWYPDNVTRLARRILVGPPNSTKSGLLEWAGIESVITDYQDQVALAETATKLLGPDVPQNVVQASCAALYERVPTKDSLTYIAYRLAANVERIRCGITIPRISQLQAPTEAPLEIVHAYPGQSRGKKPQPGTKLVYKVIDGEHCPLEFVRWHPGAYLPVMAKQLGIVTRKRPWSGNRVQLVGMRMVALLERSKYDKDAVTFEMWQPGQFSGFNKKLQARREEPCPAGYSWPCWRCSVGVDTCPANTPVSRACRPVTLALRWCTVCKDQVLHDGIDCTVCRSPTSARSQQA